MTTTDITESDCTTTAKMTPKQWLALFCFYISYLLFGASIFYHIERDLEVKNYAIELQRRIDVNGNSFKNKKKTESNLLTHQHQTIIWELLIRKTWNSNISLGKQRQLFTIFCQFIWEKMRFVCSQVIFFQYIYAENNIENFEINTCFHLIQKAHSKIKQNTGRVKC